MKQSILNQHKKWYMARQSVYNELRLTVEDIITKILDSKKVESYDISSRVKEIDSFLTKIQKKGSSDDPTQITDFAGVRIIGYVQSDVAKIVTEVQKEFKIDKNNSLDKSKILGEDKIGYHSIHFVASLSNNRIKLTENKKFVGLKFELQIRTILQHAWAEIEHNRKYKFSGKLPSGIPRRFNLISGLLEVADTEFEHITKLIDNYVVTVKTKTKTKTGRLSISINSISLIQYMLDKFKNSKHVDPDFGSHDVIMDCIKELENLNINTLEDLEKLIPKNIEKIYEKTKHNTTFAGVLRHIMIISFKEKYFEKGWVKVWDTWDSGTFLVLKEYKIDTKRFDKFIKQTSPKK